jgi:hypothetical protein
VSEVADAEVDPPFFLKALGVVMGVSFLAGAVLVAANALGRPFAVGSLLSVVALAACGVTLLGLFFWRTRLYVREDAIVVERRGYFGTTRRTFAAADVELSLEREATWGLLAKASVPRFVVKTRNGEVLLREQWVGVEELARRIATKMNRPLPG